MPKFPSTRSQKKQDFIRNPALIGTFGAIVPTNLAVTFDEAGHVEPVYSSTVAWEASHND